MSDVPTVGRYYVGGPHIAPAYLIGRRLLVVALLTFDDLLAGRVGFPPDPRVASITVRVVRRGRVEEEAVDATSWDGVEVPAAPARARHA